MHLQLEAALKADPDAVTTQILQTVVFLYFKGDIHRVTVLGLAADDVTISRYKVDIGPAERTGQTFS